VQIADYQATETAMDKVRALLDARQPAEAIAFADACEGDQPLVTQVRHWRARTAARCFATAS